MGKTGGEDTAAAKPERPAVRTPRYKTERPAVRTPPLQNGKTGGEDTAATKTANPRDTLIPPL